MSFIRVLRTTIACSLAAILLVVGCSTMSPSGSADPKACSQNLDAAYSRLDYSKSKGNSAKVEWAKAEGVGRRLRYAGAGVTEVRCARGTS